MTDEKNGENSRVIISRIKQELLDESCKGWKRITRLGTLWKWYKQYCLKYMMNLQNILKKMYKEMIIFIWIWSIGRR